MDQLIEYPVPLWIKVAFLFAILVPVVMVLSLVNSVSRPGVKGRTLWVGLFFLMYIGYVLIVGLNNGFASVFFPPKVLLLSTLPFLLILFAFVATNAHYGQFLRDVQLHRLVEIHVFRLIGLFFLLLAYHHALPVWFGVVAGLGDILTALCSIVVGKMIRSQKQGIKRIVLAWNTFGLLDIIFTAVSANVLTKISIDQGIMGVDTLAMFPFFLIPALAPPLIIFLHYSIYRKLKMSGAAIS
jgi:hypothetical protein